MRWWLAAVLALAPLACGGDDPAADIRPVAIHAWGCALTDEVATGVVVGEDLVLTVGHVLRNAERVSADGREGAVVAVDRRLDAALIAVTTTGPLLRWRPTSPSGRRRSRASRVRSAARHRRRGGAAR